LFLYLERKTKRAEIASITVSLQREGNKHTKKDKEYVWSWDSIYWFYEKKCMQNVSTFCYFFFWMLNRVYRE